MKFPSPKIHDHVLIRRAGSQQQGTYGTRILATAGQGILIEWPTGQPKFTAAVGEEIDVQFKRPDAVYRFAGKVLALSGSDGLPALFVEHPREILRTQRREHFRIDVLLRAWFRLHSDDSEDSDNPWRQARVLNLSAGGIRMDAPAQDTLNVSSGTTLDLEVTLSDESLLKGIVAQVLKMDPDPRDHKRSVMVARYLDLDPKTREAIAIHNIRYQLRWRTERPEEEAPE